MPKHHAIPLRPAQGWQEQMAQAISEPLTLLQQLQIDPGHFPQCQDAQQGFQLKVPQAYWSKMTPGDPRDPLLLQVMSRAEELQPARGFSTDPVGDLNAARAPGLLHKYAGRVLLITTGACAIHCRYCFRRHFPYSEQQTSRQQAQAALDYIRQHPDVHEVILSGGDPLSLSDQKLGELLTELEAIPHLTRLRLHSRLPVVLPDRITPALLARLGSSRLASSLVIHANHARELGEREQAVLQQLRQANITLLNQSVLLRGINDRSDILIELSERLYACGVLPYYLHMLDPVAGAAHFDVVETQALALMSELRTRLPGYLVPRLVRETAGQHSKTPVFGL